MCLHPLSVGRTMTRETASNVADIRTTPFTAEDSSLVRGLAYHPELEILEVRLERDGNEVPYYYSEPSHSPSEMSAGFYERFCDAHSLGAFYNQYVKAGHNHKRDYRDVSEEHSEDLRQKLRESTHGFVDIIAEHDSSLLLENSDLFESIRRRESDFTVLHIRDNDNVVTELTQEFRNQMIRMGLLKVIDKHGTEPDWVDECFDRAEECSSVVQTYRFVAEI